MPALLQIMESVLTSFWGIIGLLGLFFGIADLLKHLGNRLDKRRGMEIYRELMKDRFGLMNTAVQFGADAPALAELGKLLERHGNLSELKQLVEIRVMEESEGSPKLIVRGQETELQSADVDRQDSQSSMGRQTEG